MRIKHVTATSIVNLSNVCKFVDPTLLWKINLLSTATEFYVVVIFYYFDGNYSFPICTDHTSKM
jgi:hypothetical protein